MTIARKVNDEIAQRICGCGYIVLLVYMSMYRGRVPAGWTPPYDDIAQRFYGGDYTVLQVYMK